MVLTGLRRRIGREFNNELDRIVGNLRPQPTSAAER